MDISQLIISSTTTIIGSVLTYFASLKKIDSKIQEAKIKSDTEIKKIQEKSKKEIERIKTETSKEIEKMKVEQEEYRKNSMFNSKIKEENMKNNMAYNFINKIIENPETADKQVESFIELANKFSKNK